MSPKKAKAKAKPALKKAALPRKGERPMALGIFLTLAVTAALLWQAFQLAKMKSAQHFFVTPLLKIVPQGEQPGQVGNPHAIEAGPANSVYTLHRFESRQAWMIQRLDSGLALVASKEFPDKAPKQPLRDVTDMAVDVTGTVHLVSRDARVLVLDAAFKQLREIKLEANESNGLEIGADGGYYSLDAAGRKVARFSPDGKAKGETPAKKLIAPKRMTVTDSGNIAVLDEAKAGYVIKVFSPELAFLRSISVANLPSSPPVRIAAGAKGVVAVNDAHGAHGVQFYGTDDGKFLGETLGVGDEPLIHPGFVAGDPKTGDFYLHFGPGLLKCRIPE